MLRQWVEENGLKKGVFARAAEKLPHRNADQCYQRWHHCLDPAINKEPWSEKEDKILIDAHKQLGNKWVAISKHLPGRTDKAIRNRWRSIEESTYKTCPWTVDEDLALQQGVSENVKKNGELKKGTFGRIAKTLPQKTPDQCRNRWHYL